MQEKEIVQVALKHLQALTGIDINEVSMPATPTNHKPDTRIDLHVAGKKISFWVEVKNELRHLQLLQLIDAFGKDAKDCLIICQYISKPGRALLQKKNINYLDASGNCNIRKGTLIICINDQKVFAQRKSGTSILWKPAGLKLLFSFLLDPGLMNETFRTIALRSKLSLGSVGALMQELDKEKDYFSKYKNEYQIENREALLNRWIETYQSVLRPKLTQGKFRFLTSKDREQWQRRNTDQVFWGGEPAGALLTKYLHPEKFVVYSQMPKVELMKQLMLVPDNSGEVELLKTFWDTEQTRKEFPNTVPPLLAYAELLASVDSRNRETAERIKEQFNI